MTQFNYKMLTSFELTNMGYGVIFYDATGADVKENLSLSLRGLEVCYPVD